MTDGPRCGECGERFDSRHELVDHLTDAHDAFSWVADGRPMVEGAEPSVNVAGGD